LAQLDRELDENTICVAAQSPNFFGVLESWDAISSAAQEKKALTVAVVTEALSLALLRSPGEGGCDIAVGEAQSFGVPLSFGGPYLGFMAAKDRHKRAMPGRLVGETVDVDGKRAFVLTLATREQHIRREKATSNICTNQALCALAATLYLSLHGKVGLRDLAEINVQRAAALRRRLASLTGFESSFEGPCFNEFALRSERPVAEVLDLLQGHGILGGVALGEFYPELEDSFLVAVTECNEAQELDRFVEYLAAGILATETLPVTV
jgi:glycine dehydrogenase subunit 1